MFLYCLISGFVLFVVVVVVLGVGWGGGLCVCVGLFFLGGVCGGGWGGVIKPLCYF